MGFVFAGDFDLRKKVSMDLTGKEQGEILGVISRILDCVVTLESPGVYRLSPKSGGEPLEEPPVEEEPAPDEGSGSPEQESP